MTPEGYYLRLTFTHMYTHTFTLGPHTRTHNYKLIHINSYKSSIEMIVITKRRNRKNEKGCAWGSGFSLSTLNSCLPEWFGRDSSVEWEVLVFPCDVCWCEPAFDNHQLSLRAVGTSLTFLLYAPGRSVGHNQVCGLWTRQVTSHMPPLETP